MKIKKLIANNIKEGKQKVIEELGEEAVILSNRTIIDPKTSKEVVEIVAAIDDTEQKKPSFEKITLPRTNLTLDKTQDKFLETTSKIFEEIAEVSNKVNLINEQIKFKFLNTYPDELRYFHKNLIDNEFSDETALNIISEIYNHYPGNDRNAIEEQFNKIVARKIKFEGYLNKDRKQNVVILVGPAGSGKTMSLVKMATIAKLAFGSDVAIISTDTYKVSGLDQLQTYASIAAIPFAKAENLEELKQILTREYNKDILFIDTIGKSANDDENIRYIRDLAKFTGSNHIYLCLPANLTKRNYHYYFKKYSVVVPNGLIVTKCDEASAIGQLFEALLVEDIPLSYFSTGQMIPDNFEKANPDYFVKLLLKS